MALNSQVQGTGANTFQTQSLGGSQVAGPAPATPLNAPQGGQQPLNQPQQGAPGVAPSSVTPPSQPGWTYGMNPTQTQIQGSVAPGQADTSQIDPTQMPVSSVGGAQGYFQPAVDAYQQQAMSRLNPQLAEQQAQLENQLQQQGLTRGSSAWNAEMDRQMRARNDAMMGVTNQALMLGGQEAARMQGMDLNAGNFANQAAQQNFANRGQSQQWQNQAFNQQFQQNLASGQFANAAQAQEAAQNAVQAQIRNQGMAAQGGLAEQTAARQQQASQFAQSYDLQNREQQAQMDQFAQSLGMTGRQLDAQIGQWAAQNGISREQMANQLLMSREQNTTQRDVAGMNLQGQQAIAGANLSAAQANAAVQQALGQGSLDLQNRQFGYNTTRQSQFDPLLWQNMAASIPGFTGTNPFGNSFGGNQVGSP